MPQKFTHPGVYVEEVPSGVHSITGVAMSTTAFVGPTSRGQINVPASIASFTGFAQQFGGLAPGLETGYAVQQFFLNGGTSAWVVPVAATATAAQLGAGIAALDAVDLFNLLVLPGVTDPAVLAAASDYCRKRRAFLIVDAPAGAQTPTQMQQAVQGFSFQSKSYAAVYYPWIKIADPLNNGQLRITPPGGTIAGLIARTDATRGVWKAPAGVEAVLKGVQGLGYNLGDGENGNLNPLGVNCLRTFPATGFVAWGARTLGDDPEWKYIPVRRLASFIEESLYRGTKWAVFEPNGEPLWAQLRLNVGAFLNNLWRQGAFQGSTPQDAYFVQCDRGTTTQVDINNGMANLMVKIAPLKPAEFVILKLQVKTAG